MSPVTVSPTQLLAFYTRAYGSELGTRVYKKCVLDRSDPEHTTVQQAASDMVSGYKIFVEEATTPGYHAPIDPLLREPEHEADLYVSDSQHSLPLIFDLKKRLEQDRWKAEDIDLTVDIRQFRGGADEGVSDLARDIILRVHLFFAGADGIVADNVVTNLYRHIKHPDIRAFLAEQIANEQVHNETYNRILEAFAGGDKQLYERLKYSASRMAFIRHKNGWMRHWIDSVQDDARKIPGLLVAFACVEHVFFSSSFAFVGWLKSLGLFPGAGQANEYIQRDEGKHVQHLLMVHHALRPENRISNADILAIFEGAVRIEKTYAGGVLGEQGGQAGMSERMMHQYIELMAYRVLRGFGLEKEAIPYQGTVQPFDFMNANELVKRENFFEVRVTQYIEQKHASVSGKTNNDTGALLPAPPNGGATQLQQAFQDVMRFDADV